MTPIELRDARDTLGTMWGLGRPLKMSEMGRAVGLGGRDPGAGIRDYERGKTATSGPLARLVRCYLAGMLPPDGLGCIES